MTQLTHDNERGRTASRPTEVPATGWKDVLARVRIDARRDNVTLLAGGVAFFALLALVPALIALVSLYGLVAEPDDVQRQVTDALAAAPSEVRDVVTQQLSSITSDSGGALGLTAIISIAVALWSASSGIANLMAGINAAYDEDETRGFIKRRGVALAFTIGAIVFLVVAFGLIAILPSVLADTGLGTAGRIAAGIARWVLLLGAMILALGILYRYGPDRDDAKWSWVSPGALVATALWLAGSALFAVYTANFGKYNETYGSMGAVVVVMLWLYISALAVLVGAEINAELERQTFKDTTRGRPQPLGARRATAADTVGPTADEIRHGARGDSP
jgi:membrane protein